MPESELGGGGAWNACYSLIGCTIYNFCTEGWRQTIFRTKNAAMEAACEADRTLPQASDSATGELTRLPSAPPPLQRMRWS